MRTTFLPLMAWLIELEPGSILSFGYGSDGKPVLNLPKPAPHICLLLPEAYLVDPRLLKIDAPDLV